MKPVSALNIHVRRATPADAPAMVDVQIRSWLVTYDGLVPGEVIDDVVKSGDTRVERWRTRLAEPGARSGAFVGEAGDRIVGFVFWGPSEESDSSSEIGEIYAIYLDPEFVGRGIGRSLFATAVDEIAAAGFSSAVLWVLAENELARRFYEAAGWRPDGATKSDVRAGGVLEEVRYARTLTRGALDHVTFPNAD